MGETAAAKVFHWLEEEEYQPKEADEPEADFNFSIKVAAYALDVIHGPRDDAIRKGSSPHSSLPLILS